MIREAATRRCGAYGGMSERDRFLDLAARIALIAVILLALVVQLGLIGRSASEPSDLGVERELLDAARGQNWLSLLGLVGLAATVYFAYRAWREAQAANLQTREQFVLERRPWIQVVAKISGPFPDWESLVDRRRASFRIHYELKNVGKTPAFDVFFHGPLSSMPNDKFGLAFAEMLRQHKEQIRPQTEEAEMRGGKALFPDQVWAITEYPASFGDLGEFRSRWIPVIGGIAYYRTKPDGEFHFTPVTWRVVFPGIEDDFCAPEDIRLRDWSYRGLQPD